MASKNLGKAAGGSAPAGMCQGKNALMVSEKVRDVNYQLNALDGALTVLDQELDGLFDRLLPVMVDEEKPDTCKGIGTSAQRISPIGCRVKDCREIIERMTREIKQVTDELQI